MQLRVEPSGNIVCLYDETIDLATLGALSIQRASHVEADDAGRWWAELSPVQGPRIGPFVKRSAALHAETTWLNQQLFPSPSCS